MRTSKDGEAEALPENRGTGHMQEDWWGGSRNQLITADYMHIYFCSLVNFSKKTSYLFTWIHLANFLNEGFIKASNYSTTYWNHKIFVQALNESIDSTNPSPLESNNIWVTCQSLGQTTTSINEQRPQQKCHTKWYIQFNFIPTFTKANFTLIKK